MNTISNIFFVLTMFSFVLVSDVQGQDWKPIETSVSTNLILYDMVFPAGQSDVGYIGGSNVTYNGKGKILKTIDNGLSWTVVFESEESKTGVESIYFFNTQKGLAGTHGGYLLKTEDGGTSWSTIDVDPDNTIGFITRIQFADAQNGTLLSLWGGIYNTNDGGETWTVATTNLSGGGQDFCYATDQILYANGNNFNIYKSEDGGENWSLISEGAIASISLGVDFIDAKNGMVTSEEGNFKRTFDGGETWINGQIPNQFGLNNDILFYDYDTIYVLSTPGTVIVSKDGGETWSEDSPVDFDPSYYRIVFTDNGTGLVSGSGANGGTILRREAPIMSSNNSLNLQHIEIYPNPVKSKLFIDLQDHQNNISQVRLSTINGKVVSVVDLKQIHQKTILEIDCKDLARGSYILELKGIDHQIVTKKIMIQ